MGDHSAFVLCYNEWINLISVNSNPMKNLTQLALVSILVSTVFIFGSTLKALTVNAQSMNVSQLVELLISIGAIAPNKVAAARAMISTLNQTISVTSTSTSYIQVLAPNGGESWSLDVGVPYTITWGSVGLTQVRVALVSAVKNSPVCNLSLSPVTSLDGNHEFKVLLKNTHCYNLATSTSTSTPLKEGAYKVRVYSTDAAGQAIQDESNGTFNILPVPVPSIKVIYPNGGENLTLNKNYAVKYTLKDVTNSVDGLLYFYLLDNNGKTIFYGHKIISGGTFDLNLPSSLPAGAYKLKLTLTTQDKRVEIVDTSDNLFWVSVGL